MSYSPNSTAPHAPTTGQGYLPYPYADSRALETFVLSDVREGRSFGSISGT